MGGGPGAAYALFGCICIRKNRDIWCWSLDIKSVPCISQPSITTELAALNFAIVCGTLFCFFSMWFHFLFVIQIMWLCYCPTKFTSRRETRMRALVIRICSLFLNFKTILDSTVASFGFVMHFQYWKRQLSCTCHTHSKRPVLFNLFVFLLQAKARRGWIWFIKHKLLGTYGHQFLPGLLWRGQTIGWGWLDEGENDSDSETETSHSATISWSQKNVNCLFHIPTPFTQRLYSVSHVVQTSTKLSEYDTLESQFMLQVNIYNNGFICDHNVRRVIFIIASEFRVKTEFIINAN